MPIPKDPNGKPAIHYTSVYRAFATWAHDGSLEQTFMASVAHLSAEKHLDLGVLHGDGTNTVAPTGVTGAATRAISPNKGRVVFQKWRWTGIAVTLGLVFVASSGRSGP